MVMQPTYPWDRDDGPLVGRLHRPPIWSIHGQRQVRAPDLIIMDILREQASEVVFAEDHYLIQAVSPDAAD